MVRDREAWCAAVPRVSNSGTWPGDWTMTTTTTWVEWERLRLEALIISSLSHEDKAQLPKVSKIFCSYGIEGQEWTRNVFLNVSHSWISKWKTLDFILKCYLFFFFSFLWKKKKKDFILFILLYFWKIFFSK